MNAIRLTDEQIAKLTVLMTDESNRRADDTPTGVCLFSHPTTGAICVAWCEEDIAEGTYVFLDTGDFGMDQPLGFEFAEKVFDEDNLINFPNNCRMCGDRLDATKHTIGNICGVEQNACPDCYRAFYAK